VDQQDRLHGGGHSSVICLLRVCRCMGLSTLRNFEQKPQVQRLLVHLLADLLIALAVLLLTLRVQRISEKFGVCIIKTPRPQVVMS
jgi:hypothetical protein